jgi:hypothetical protein
MIHSKVDVSAQAFVKLRASHWDETYRCPAGLCFYTPSSVSPRGYCIKAILETDFSVAGVVLDS